MQSVQAIAQDILRREGGFVNDPDDPGGATNFGVTIHTMRRLGLDLDGDGDVDVADVRRLTEAQAQAIFIEQYFERPKINLLPEPLHPSVFDMYVNAGAQAVRILQRLLAEFGFPTGVDGVIGPNTAAAAASALQSAPDHLVSAYGIARRNYYYNLAAHRPSLRKYAVRRDGGKGGWIARAESFIAPRYHLTRAQHDAIVRGWS